MPFLNASAFWNSSAFNESRFQTSDRALIIFAAASASAESCSAVVTYQTPTYANELYARCDALPEGHDPTDLGAAMARARADRFQLGLLYRRPVAECRERDSNPDGLAPSGI